MQFPVNFRQQGKYGKMPQAEYGAGPMRGKAGGDVFQGNVFFLTAVTKDEKEDALFLSSQGKRINVRSVQNLVKKYSSGVTVKNISPHKLRSTFGTNLYQETGLCARRESRHRPADVCPLRVCLV